MLVSLEKYEIINAKIHDIRPIEIIKFFFALKSFLYHPLLRILKLVTQNNQTHKLGQLLLAQHQLLISTQYLFA